MSKVDLTKVAGFKAVDAEGNDMGVVTLSEITNMVKESIIQEAVAMQSVSTLAETSTLAATDTYEDKLDISDTFSYVRTLDASGNPKRTSQDALATVVGELLPVVSEKSAGLAPTTLYENNTMISTNKSLDDVIQRGEYLLLSGRTDGIDAGIMSVRITNNYIQQSVFEFEKSKLKYRIRRSAGVWTEWITI